MKKRNYKELLDIGNKAQIEKLMLNEHKKDFNELSFDYGIKRICEEVHELVIEVLNFYKSNSDESLEYLKRIRNEAADVANFAHMIIMKCDNEIRFHENG